MGIVLGNGGRVCSQSLRCSSGRALAQAAVESLEKTAYILRTLNHVPLGATGRLRRICSHPLQLQVITAVCFLCAKSVTVPGLAGAGSGGVSRARAARPVRIGLRLTPAAAAAGHNAKAGDPELRRPVQAVWSFAPNRGFAPVEGESPCLVRVAWRGRNANG